MSGLLFLDTSGWLAALSPREAAHARTREIYEGQIGEGGRLLTTSLILAEMHTLVLRFRGSAPALALLDQLAADPSHEVIDVDRELRLAAVERWLRRFNDHDFSLADAVSFEVMRRRRVRKALALDRHFVEAGFELA